MDTIGPIIILLIILASPICCVLVTRSFLTSFKEIIQHQVEDKIKEIACKLEHSVQQLNARITAEVDSIKHSAIREERFLIEQTSKLTDVINNHAKLLSEIKGKVDDLRTDSDCLLEACNLLQADVEKIKKPIEVKIKTKKTK